MEKKFIKINDIIVDINSIDAVDMVKRDVIVKGYPIGLSYPSFKALVEALEKYCVQ